MIDFLVVTVVFLLMTFWRPARSPLDKNVKLPKAENTLDMIDAPMVARQRQPDPRRRHARRHTRAIEDGKRLQRIDELFNMLKAQARALEAAAQPGQGLPGRRASSRSIRTCRRSS